MDFAVTKVDWSAPTSTIKNYVWGLKKLIPLSHRSIIFYPYGETAASNINYNLDQRGAEQAPVQLNKVLTECLPTVATFRLLPCIQEVVEACSWCSSEHYTAVEILEKILIYYLSNARLNNRYDFAQRVWAFNHGIYECSTRQRKKVWSEWNMNHFLCSHIP